MPASASLAPVKPLLAALMQPSLDKDTVVLLVEFALGAMVLTPAHDHNLPANAAPGSSRPPPPPRAGPAQALTAPIEP